MFYPIRKKIAAKLAVVIVFVVTAVSVISTLYFNNINKRNLTEYLNISLSNSIYFAEIAYAQPLWDYNEKEINHLSQVILRNKLITAVNVFEIDNFLTGNAKKPIDLSNKNDSYRTQPHETSALNHSFDTASEYELELLKEPYLIKENSPYIKKISGNITLNEKTVGRFEIFYTEEFIHNAIVMSNKRMILSFIIIAALIITVVMLGANKINKPILELALLSEKIAQDNDFSITIEKSDRIDEVGILLNGFVNMIEQIRQKEMERNTLYETLQKNLERFRFLFFNLQNAIDSADYSLRIQPESDKDELANSLNKVMETLEESNIAKYNQNWLKNGQTELSGIIGREQDILSISCKAIEFIAAYVNAKVGTFFVKDETRKDFRMVASYAFKTRKGFSNRFKPGEGLNGQAALEKKTIIFTEVPDNYIKIESSLGNAIPENLAIIPVIYEDDVKGVIELGFSRSCSGLQIEFLEIASEILAVSINSAIFNEKLSTLLAQTSEQAEELKAQQEELKATNEELEEQTRILKASEEQLQAQQEELRASNEELEEKTNILKAQKKEIEQSNSILKSKQMEIEEKASQLRIETKYKSEFLANMSHELRTPLNSLLILANMLAENEEKNLTPDQIDSAASIYRSGQNLLYLINNILDLSKIEAKKVELNIAECSIKEIAANFKTEFMHMAKAKGIEFNVVVTDNLPEIIKTDMHRLEQIIRNLVGNAIKFTETGTITLLFTKPCSESSIEEKTSNAYTLSKEHSKVLNTECNELSLDQEKTIAISVNDTGSGIPSDKIDEIFEAFKQVDGSIRRKHDGTGLGLSISKELANLLGGHITVQSELGKGSTFNLYIPENIDKNCSIDSDSRLCNQSKIEPNLPIISKGSTYEQEILNKSLPESFHSMLKTRDSLGQNPETETNTESYRSDSYNAHSESRDYSDNSSSSSAAAASSKTMLIIEDDPEFAKILSNFFKKNGYTAIVAETGEDGIRRILDDKPTAVILDIALPGIDGWAVMNELKNNPDTRHIPVHIMSGYDQSRKGLEKGALGYLTKPVSINDLNNALLKIETVLSNDVKHLLVVEDNSELQLSIMKLMGANDIKVTSAITGEEALSLLKERHFDCMILDLGLPDISGFELIDRISKDPAIEILPIIVFTGRDLTSEETKTLEEYASSIVLKNAVSMERLIDETALFLHRVENELPEKQRKMIKKIRDQQASLKDKKVLVVDDDMRNAFALNKFLKSRGMEVIIANNGEKALNLLEDGNIPDIILMDIMMPVMDGYETIRRIRSNSKFKEIPIIALTAKAMSSDRDECIRCGANDYLSKPLDTTKLLTLFRVWLYS